FANGFEEDGALVLDLARYPDYRTIGQALSDYWKSEWPSHGMAALTRLSVDLASGKVESRTYDTGTAHEVPTANLVTSANAIVTPISPAIRPTACAACSSSWRGSIWRAVLWRGTISAPTLMSASRSSSPRVPGLRRMTAWSRRWCSMPNADAAT